MPRVHVCTCVCVSCSSRFTVVNLLSGYLIVILLLFQLAHTSAVTNSVKTNGRTICRM